jgi:hypothetical protein
MVSQLLIAIAVTILGFSMFFMVRYLRKHQ